MAGRDSVSDVNRLVDIGAWTYA